MCSSATTSNNAEFVTCRDIRYLVIRIFEKKREKKGLFPFYEICLGLILRRMHLVPFGIFGFVTE